MMTEPQDMLMDVIFHPEDDAPRLRIADWLSSHDDPRGEFIRIQCQLAKLSLHDSERKKLMNRNCDLLRSYRTEWVSHLIQITGSQYPGIFSFTRGFVEHISLSATKYLAASDRLIACTPLRSVGLSGFRGHIHQIAECKTLSKLRGLRFGDPLGHLTLEELSALSHSKFIAKINDLRLMGNPIGDAGAAVVAMSPNWSALRKLVLCDTRIGDEGVRSIAFSSNLKNLHILDLTGNHITDLGANLLANTPYLQHIQHLLLGSYSLHGQRSGQPLNSIGGEARSQLCNRFGLTACIFGDDVPDEWFADRFDEA